MPFQPILPTWLALNGCNDTSASGMTDLRTLQPVNAGGLNLGDYFDLTTKEAFQLSNTATGTLFSGRYRRVQVDSGATAANVKVGTIGLLADAAAQQNDGYGTLPLGMNVVTSYDKGINGATTVRPVIFLNTVTPGNFCFVQELGVATVLAKTGLTGTGAIGAIVASSASGLADVPASTTAVTTTSIGIALDLPVSATKFRILMQYVPVVQD